MVPSILFDTEILKESYYHVVYSEFWADANLSSSFFFDIPKSFIVYLELQ